MGIEQGRQGPGFYYGTLKPSDEVKGGVSIWGPFSYNGEMYYGEVYVFAPPGTSAPILPVVDFEWLRLQIGNNVKLHAAAKEGPRLCQTYEFHVQQPDGTQEVTFFK